MGGIQEHKRVGVQEQPPPAGMGAAMAGRVLLRMGASQKQHCTRSRSSQRQLGWALHTKHACSDAMAWGQPRLCCRARSRSGRRNYPGWNNLADLTKAAVSHGSVIETDVQALLLQNILFSTSSGFSWQFLFCSPIQHV